MLNLAEMFDLLAETDIHYNLVETDQGTCLVMPTMDVMTGSTYDTVVEFDRNGNRLGELTG